jgi:hypothetical protein
MKFNPVVALWVWLGSASVWADTALLAPSADTALLENFSTNNFGGQTWLNAGTTQNYTRNRGLLRFDVAGRLPARARIRAASLTVEVVRSPVDGDTPSTFDLHRLLRDWGEGRQQGEPPLLGAPAELGECNWTHRFALTPETWAEPGGKAGLDYATDLSADTFVYGVNFSPYVFESTSNLVADVQLWQRQPERNFGWMLKTRAETDNFSARRFASREDSFRAPILAIEYELPRIDELTSSNGSVEIRFRLEAGESAELQACDELAPSASGALWHSIAAVPVMTNLTYVLVTDAPPRARRFYRLVVR